jgi:hypothetical protein
VDAVSSDHPIRACISKDDVSKGLYLQLLKASPDLPKLKASLPGGTVVYVIKLERAKRKNIL